MRTLAVVVLALLPVGCSKSRDSSGGRADTTEMTNRLKRLGLALHAHADTTGVFPGGVFTTGNRVGLSWRVQLLPYMEQQALHAQFKLAEPWDSEHNKALIPLMPEVYATPGATAPAGHTFVRGFGATGGPAVAFFPGPLEIGTTTARTPGSTVPGRKISSISDGTSNSFMVVEAAEAVPWTKPEILECDPAKPLPMLGSVRGGFLALMADGSVRLFRENISHASLRFAITVNDGNPLPAEINDPVWPGR